MTWLKKDAARLPVFIASDGCTLTEVIHPQNDQTVQGLSVARASLAPGGRTRPHHLEFVEVYYILTGQGIMHLEDQAVPVEPDSCIYLPAQTKQWVQNTSEEKELVFLCICHPAYDPAGDHNLG